MLDFPDHVLPSKSNWDTLVSYTVFAVTGIVQFVGDTTKVVAPVEAAAAEETVELLD